MNGGFVCWHTLLVLWCTSRDKLFLETSDRNKNILLWTGLLHDLTKRGAPVLEGKDHIHPFTGSSVTLTILHRIGAIENEEPSEEKKGTEYWINEV
jgi:hypothetical protein